MAFVRNAALSYFANGILLITGEFSRGLSVQACLFCLLLVKCNPLLPVALGLVGLFISWKATNLGERNPGQKPPLLCGKP